MGRLTNCPEGNFWRSPISDLPGIGPAKAQLLSSDLEIYTFWDLLNYFPYRFIDKSIISPISAAHQTEETVNVLGVLTQIRLIGEGRAKRMVANFRDAESAIELVWFQGIPYLSKILKEGGVYTAYGKPTEFRGSFQITHPDMLLKAEAEQQTGLQALYSSTEKLKKRGLDSKGIEKLIKTLLDKAIQYEVPDILNEEYRKKHRIKSRKSAYFNMHIPSSFQEFQLARTSIKHEELLILQFSVLALKLNRKETVEGPLFEEVGNSFNTYFHKYLPFELTNAQKKVIREVRKDTFTGKQMNRLVQGDVGSGKTMVAMMAMLLAIDNGFQCCMMAPTEILARQHFASILDLKDKLGIEVELLTGNIKGKKRAALLERLNSGQINILVGTHALIEDPVQFKQLGLAIIDEQHRFGVAQRAALWKKASPPPHILVMTATPIPRTLAMSVYGDLDISVIDELPPGRKPVTTVVRNESSRDNVNQFLASEMKKGRQVYMVFPLIEESEKLEHKALLEEYHKVAATFPMPEFHISIVHGKLKQEEKETEMQRFLNKETQIMVATTVIEVGVNVPNASVMVIENAEKFGLSQLHQLRGRVGRGAEQSYCILMTGEKVSNDARKRLKTMSETNDGFVISEVDMELRGPGDITGTQQSGIINMKVADLAVDGELLSQVREYANEELQNDTFLTSQTTELRRQIRLLLEEKKNWKSIS